MDGGLMGETMRHKADDAACERRTGRVPDSCADVFKAAETAAGTVTLLGCFN
jgi:hypothetical protein